MSDNPRLLLVIAQSGRMLAQSAAREGYTVRVADCFGDTDTLEVSDRYLKLPPLEKISHTQWLQAIIELSDHQPCFLICGTGIERFYPALSQLPKHIQFAGCSQASFQQICVPENWIALLDKLALPHPPTQFESPQYPKEKWLSKSAAAWGGSHIVVADPVSEKVGRYYQQFIDGISGSVLFLASGGQCQLLQFNQQFSRHFEADSFSLKAIFNHLKLDLKQQHFLQQTLEKLTCNLGLSGLMSLDFQLTPSGTFYLLEINPRPPASCQVLPADLPIISWQIMCSKGKLPDIRVELPLKKQLLWFCYAPLEITIPVDFDWPDFCYDLPAAGSIINKDDVICSLLLTHDNTELEDGHLFEKMLIENLTGSA